MTPIERIDAVMTVVGYLTVLSILGFASLLVYSGIKQARKDRRDAAQFVADEQRQSDKWQAEMSKHDIEPPEQVKPTLYRTNVTQQFRMSDYPTDGFAAGSEMANRGQR